MSTEHNIVSLSGGKDSTALLLLAIERGVENLQAVFADTGNEHQLTYDYVAYLEQATGVTVRRVKADFTKQIERKRQFVTEKWPGLLMADKPGSAGYWTRSGSDDDLQSGENGQPVDPPPPVDVWSRHRFGAWVWTAAVPASQGMTAAEADAIVEGALAVLTPTGNPFLDLCIWKGRFPSTKARFCSDELKRLPMTNLVQVPLLQAGDDVVSWQGVRADESPSRALLQEREFKGTWDSGGELWNYRPILKWTVEEVFAMHRKHGIEANPLYSQGMGRVGCMPCIHARKDELLEISKRFPEEVQRISEWERIVANASKLGRSSFFAHADGHGENIHEVVQWSKTSRGLSNLDMFRAEPQVELCSSIYGLCE